jgi:hypothetical protein
MISGNNLRMMGKKTGLLIISFMSLALSASSPVVAAPGTATAADLKPVRSHVLILTRRHFCMTVDKAGAGKSAKINFLPCHGRADQRWTLSKGGYLIHYGRRLRQCLSVPENSLRQGVALRLSDCKNIAGQRWFHKQGRLFLFLPKKGLCVTPLARHLEQNGTAAVLGSCLGQKGMILNIAQKMPLPLKPVQLRLKKPALCIDKTNGLKNGVDIKMKPCRVKDARQRFKLEKKRGEDIQIQSVQSGKCLSVENAGKKPGARIQQWSCLGHDHQLWQIIEYPKGWFALKAKHSGLCLTFIRQNKQKPINFQQHRCKGANATYQQFKIVQ